VIETGQAVSGHCVLDNLSFFAMRWLMIGLLVSVGALLLAVAGVARHIWLQRSQPSSEPVVSASQSPEPADEADL
jgi:hypothetical protein